MIMKKNAYSIPTLQVIKLDTMRLLAGSTKIVEVNGDTGIELPNPSDAIPGTGDARLEDLLDF